MPSATSHGVGVITKLYFAIFSAFKKLVTLNIAKSHSRSSILVPIESAYTYSY